MEFYASRREDERGENKIRRKHPKSKPSTPSGKIVVLLYVKGLPEVTAHVLKKYDRTVLFRPTNTIGQQLIKFKDKGDPLKMSNTVYKVDCKNCEKCYIGE